MKINSGVTGVIAAFGIFVAFAYAQQGGSQSDPGMQKSDETSQQMQQQEQSSSSLMQDKKTVRQVQQALNDQGYKAGKADGKWGSKSQKALKEFQKAKGMEPTGQLNQEAITALGISPSGKAAGGQEGSMDQPSGAGGQQEDMTNQQSAPGGQEGTLDQAPGAGGQQEDMSGQQSGAGGQGSMDQQSGANEQQKSTSDQQGGSKY